MSTPPVLATSVGTGKDNEDRTESAGEKVTQTLKTALGVVKDASRKKERLLLKTPKVKVVYLVCFPFNQSDREPEIMVQARCSVANISREL
jgi:hypothetical protein